MSDTSYFQYNMRTIVHSAWGGIIRLPALMQGLGAKRILLVSDTGLKAVGIVDSIAAVFDTVHSGTMPVIAGIYTDIEPDAGSESINKCTRYAREMAVDAILAVGGGSVLDASKGVKYALHHQLLDIGEALYSGLKLEMWPKAQPMGIAHIAVPTTAGTGAEGSNGAVIHNDLTGVKGGIVAPYLDADMCVLDAQLTVGLPPSITAATGMDALTHSLEGLASPEANLFSDAHCMTSAQAITRYLPRAVHHGQDREARTQMLAAACMAVNGYLAAFNATPVHNFAHAFGAKYHIPHGDANAALLPIVFESLIDFYAPNAERLAQALNMPLSGSAGVELMRQVIARIRDLQQQTGCSTNFQKWGVKAEDMEEIIYAVASDPVAILYPLSAEKIQEISLKVIG